MNYKTETKIFDKLKTLNKFDLIIFLIPCLIFLYYLHVFDPGFLWTDSYRQLYQISTGQFDNWHPFFHTFIEMMCLKIYSSTVSIAILQIITFSTMWMIICKYNRDENQKNTLILQIVFSLVISLIPLNAFYSVTLIKDILFSYFFMFLCFLIQVIIDRKGSVSFAFVVVISIVMAFVAHLRLNGMYVILPFLLILGIYLYRKNRDNKAFLTIPALTIILILSITSLNVIYDVEDYHFDGVCDVVSNMLADYDLNLDLDSSDRDKIHELVSEKDIKKNYQSIFKDPLRKKVNSTAWNENKLTYIGIALKYSLKHPKFFVKHMFESAPITWKIVREDSWRKSSGPIYFYPDDMKILKKKFYSSNNRQAVGNYDNASLKNTGTPEYKILNSTVSFAIDNPIVSTLLNSPALYMYLAIIILAILYLMTRIKDIWLIYLPNLLNICVVFISIPAQQNRYLYPNFLVCYLLIIILIGVLMNGKSKGAST